MRSLLLVMPMLLLVVNEIKVFSIRTVDLSSRTLTSTEVPSNFTQMSSPRKKTISGKCPIDEKFEFVLNILTLGYGSNYQEPKYYHRIYIPKETTYHTVKIYGQIRYPKNWNFDTMVFNCKIYLGKYHKRNRYSVTKFVEKNSSKITSGAIEIWVSKIQILFAANHSWICFITRRNQKKLVLGQIYTKRKCLKYIWFESAELC